MRYYIADCHFYHEALLAHMDCRGFSSVEEMNDHMVACWNQKVRPCDEVVILGDLSWGSWTQTVQILDRLNGKLFLIRGNHDRFIDDPSFDPSRFGWIRDYAELNDNRRKVILFHYPIACYNGQYRKDDKGNPKTFMLHGHIHATADQKLVDDYQKKVRNSQAADPAGHMHHIPCQLINCFCQYSDYVPLTLDEWIQNDRKRQESL